TFSSSSRLTGLLIVMLRHSRILIEPRRGERFFRASGALLYARMTTAAGGCCPTGIIVTPGPLPPGEGARSAGEGSNRTDFPQLLPSPGLSLGFALSRSRCARPPSPGGRGHLLHGSFLLGNNYPAAVATIFGP